MFDKWIYVLSIYFFNCVCKVWVKDRLPLLLPTFIGPIKRGFSIVHVSLLAQFPSPLKSGGHPCLPWVSRRVLIILPFFWKRGGNPKNTAVNREQYYLNIHIKEWGFIIFFFLLIYLYFSWPNLKNNYYFYNKFSF